MTKRVEKYASLVVKSIVVAVISTTIFVGVAKAGTNDIDKEYVEYGVVAGLSEMCLGSTSISDKIMSRKIGFSFNLKQAHKSLQYMFEIGVREAYKEKMLGDNVINCTDTAAMILLKTRETMILEKLH